MSTWHDDDPLDRLLKGEDIDDRRLGELIERATRPAAASELARIDPALAAFRRSTRPTMLRRALRHARGMPAAAAAVAASVLLVGGGLGIALTHALSTPSTPTVTPAAGHTSTTTERSPRPSAPQGAHSSSPLDTRRAAHGQGPVPSIPRGSSTTSPALFYGICTAWEADQRGLRSSLHALEQSAEYQRLLAAAAARDETVASLCDDLTGTPTKGVAHPISSKPAVPLPTKPDAATSTVPGRPSQVP
jgi:hypothetical protein